MKIPRPLYLDRLIERMGNGSVKVVTGIRRCGKSFLLNELFCDHLREQGVDEGHIVKIALDDDEHEELLDRHVLSAYIRSLLKDDGVYYILLDEIQEVAGFERTLNGLMRLSNVDLFVTGSNSKFLSSDVITEFRGRGDEVRVFPLNFKEYLSGCGRPAEKALSDYMAFGGLPMILSRKSDEAKIKYLTDLFRHVYLSDVRDRNGIRSETALEAVIKVLASSVGSLTNPAKLSRAFASAGEKGVGEKTVASYITFLKEAFLIESAQRFDIKGKRYISTPMKYYFSDVGIRNAVLSFRQQEPNHIMENIIFNELISRGYNVDVGVVEHTVKNGNGNSVRKQLEVDFVCNLADRRYYIQSAWAIPDDAKRSQEIRSLEAIDDSFKKIVVVRDDVRPWHDDKGVLTLGLLQFLLDEGSLDL